MRVRYTGGNCTGCELCSVKCAGFHEEGFNPRHARIQIKKEQPDIDEPKVCRQCDHPDCMEACPVEAITRENGLVVVNEEGCIGCGECVEACPYDSMFMHPRTEKAIKCDLCGGDPECVKFCPTDVLEVVG